MNKITILTQNTLIHKKIKKQFIILLKNFIKIIFKFLLPINRRKLISLKYGGHYAVTRSIITGLKQINYPFTYNPKIKKMAELVYVPGEKEALEFAIYLKKKGIIKNIIAGPNIAILPSEITSLKDYSEIDLYLLPSTWNINWWKSINHNFPINIEPWYAGVNSNFWVPSKNKKDCKKIILYKKRVPDTLFNECKKFLENNNFIIEIIDYGHYKINDYLKMLQRNSCVVHFVEQESQGISLAESWSTDTPTIVWNPGLFSIDESNYYNGCSSSPYLTKETGEFFKNLDEFKNIFLNWNPKKYSPRNWILKNMTDIICAKKLVEITNRVSYEKNNKNIN